MEYSSLISIKAAFAGSGGAAIGSSRQMLVLSFLLRDCKFMTIFPYFGTGITFHDDEVGSDVTLSGFLSLKHLRIVS